MGNRSIDAVHAVIFDMDGVIFDSERRNLACWMEVGQRHHLKNIRRVCLACVGANARATRNIFTENYGSSISFDDFAREAYGLFHEKYRKNLPLKEGAEQILQDLAGRGIPLALASSTRRETVTAELKEAGLYSYFDACICGDMVTKSKPDPQIFLTAAEALHAVPSSCAVIEDSFNGVRAGAAAGMYTIMVPDLLQPTEEIRNLADIVLPSLFEVQELLSGVTAEKNE